MLNLPKSATRPYRLAGLALCLSAAAATLFTSGCSIQTLSPVPTEAANVAGLSGTVHGGQQPVSGATISLYATQSVTPTAGNNYGYGQPATQLGTSVLTDSGGNFSFNSQTINCPAGQQAYITAASGNPGQTANNNNLLLMAAIGPCASLSQSTTIQINEATTIAAAYALNAFMSISGSGAGAVVNISAPPNNNAATGSLTASAGLAHAFLNAANLVNSSTGAANTAVVGNSSQSAVLNGVVPQPEINALANALQSCVNSTGYTTMPTGAISGTGFEGLTAPTATVGAAAYITFGLLPDPINGSIVVTYAGGSPVTIPIAVATTLTSVVTALNAALPSGVTAAIVTGSPSISITGSAGTANTLAFTGTSIAQQKTSSNDGTACGLLFALTAPSDSSIPTNTLQAMVDLAQNPYADGNSAAIFNQAPGSGAAFLPSLAAAPTDWNMAITYQVLEFANNCSANSYGTGGNNTACTQTSIPYHLALDANDDVYFTNAEATNNSSNSAAGLNLYALTSNGTLSWVQNIISSGTSSMTASRNLASDGLGDLWLADSLTTNYSFLESSGAANTSGNASGQYKTTNTNDQSLAVDKSNNIWVGSNNTTANVSEITYNSGTSTWTATSNPSFGVTTGANAGTAVDANQNIWFATGTTTSPGFSILPNTGTVSSPAYTSGNFKYSTLTSSQGNTPYGIALDGSGNAWGTTSAGTESIVEIVPSGSGSGLTLPTNPTAGYTIPQYTSGASARYAEVDGGGVVWVADYGSHGVHEFNTATKAFLSEPGGYQPCYAATTTCGAAGSTFVLGQARTLAVDSAGAVWVPSSNASTTSPAPAGSVLQIIGPGTPTWPLLSRGTPGTRPQ